MLDYRVLARDLMPPPKYIDKWIREDKKIMFNFGIANLAITNGKYKNSKFKQRLKKSAVQNEFIDCFLNKFAKKIHIIISLKNKLIKDYFKNFLDYDTIMKQLDNLLWKKKPELPKEKPSKKISDMILKHFRSLQKYFDKYSNRDLGRCKAIQEHTYFTKQGVYKYHSRIGREFYLRTGTPPFTITIIER